VWQHGHGDEKQAGDELALIATGSEVSLALAAARQLAAGGVAVRVVSMPCVEWFADASRDWQDQVLPPTLHKRVAIEAGRGDAWYRWVGRDGAVLSIEDFGESGSGPEVLARRGLTVANITRTGREMLRAKP
jgi:transketolase